MSRLDIEEDLAMALVEMGFTALEEIAYVPAETFDEIELEADLVELLQSRAKGCFNRCVKTAGKYSRAKCGTSRYGWYDHRIAYALAARGVVTIDDLADQATDDISDIEGLGHDKAGQLIMKARESWFN